MRRAFFLVLLALVACRRESPTEPYAEQVVENLELPMVRTTPDPLIVAAGQTASVTATLTQDLFTYPLDVPIHTGDPSIATITGTIPAGKKSATLIVRGIAPGETDIVYTLVNIGRHGHSDITGRLIVTEAPAPPSPPRRRASRS